MGDERVEMLVQWEGGGGGHRQDEVPVIDQPSCKSRSKGSREG